MFNLAYKLALREYFVYDDSLQNTYDGVWMMTAETDLLWRVLETVKTDRSFVENLECIQKVGTKAEDFFQALLAFELLKHEQHLTGIEFFGIEFGYTARDKIRRKDKKPSKSREKWCDLLFQDNKSKAWLWVELKAKCDQNALKSVCADLVCDVVTQPRIDPDRTWDVFELGRLSAKGNRNPGREYELRQSRNLTRPHNHFRLGIAVLPISTPDARIGTVQAQLQMV